ncbi:MAG: hypothetical protein RSD36_12730 [Terrisporobacter sp.]
MKKRNNSCGCKGLADQYMTMVTIYAAIINQEFDNADDLEIFAEFLVALGEQLAFAASIRGSCEENSEETDFEVDVNDVQQSNNRMKSRTQRNYIEKKASNKKVRKKSSQKK